MEYPYHLVDLVLRKTQVPWMPQGTQTESSLPHLFADLYYVRYVHVVSRRPLLTLSRWRGSSFRDQTKLLQLIDVQPLWPEKWVRVENGPPECDPTGSMWPWDVTLWTPDTRGFILRPLPDQPTRTDLLLSVKNFRRTVSSQTNVFSLVCTKIKWDLSQVKS